MPDPTRARPEPGQLTPFNFDGTPVRVLTDEHGEPWFVLSDLCAILGIGNARMVAARLDDDEKGVSQADTLGGPQQVTTVTEPGMWRVILRSDSPAAEPVRRWVTHDVLPQIRRTGSYSTAPAPAAITRADLARMVLDAEEEIKVLTPRAEAFDAFLSTTGDYSVNEAAKILSRDHAILTGERRLRSWMISHAWMYRDQATTSPRAYQRRIDAGLLAERAQWHYHPESGEKVLDAPQVRVTALGIEALARALTRTTDQGELSIEAAS